MAQKSSKRLELVLKLAKLREQQAAEKLAAALHNVQQYEQQQRQLQDYQHEYDERSNALSTPVMDAAQLQNFQRFYAQLDDALDSQRERICLAEQQREAARQQWQEQYLREKNLNTLVDKKRSQEEREQENKLQREQDDRPPRKHSS